MSFLRMFYSFFVVFLLITSFQAFPSEDCQSSFFLTPLEELDLSPETVKSLQNKGVRTFSDLQTEEEKELTAREQLKSLLNRLEEELVLRGPSLINIQDIQRIFSFKANYAKYKGQEGYLLFMERTLNINSMGYVFSLVSKALGKDFKELGWQQYHGFTEGFSKERDQILNFNGSVKEEYKGMSGYARYAEKYHGKAMQKAFINVSAVLGGYWGMKEIGLNWKKFRGSVFEYYNLFQLFEVNKAMDFEGIEGQRKVAEEIFGGDKRRAYLNVSLFREVLVGSKKPLKDTMRWLPNLR